MEWFIEEVTKAEHASVDSEANGGGSPKEAQVLLLCLL